MRESIDDKIKEGVEKYLLRSNLGIYLIVPLIAFFFALAFKNKIFFFITLITYFVLTPLLFYYSYKYLKKFPPKIIVEYAPKWFKKKEVLAFFLGFSFSAIWLDIWFIDFFRLYGLITIAFDEYIGIINNFNPLLFILIVGLKFLIVYGLTYLIKEQVPETDVYYFMKHISTNISIKKVSFWVAFFALFALFEEILIMLALTLLIYTFNLDLLLVVILCGTIFGILHYPVYKSKIGAMCISIIYIFSIYFIMISMGIWYSWLLHFLWNTHIYFLEIYKNKEKKE